MGKLNKRSLRYTRIWYTLCLVNFDRFCQHSSITDADEIYDMVAVRDLSTSNAVFKSVVNNKLDDHAQGAHTSSVSVYGRNIKKCMGEYIEESYIVNLYRGMSKSKLKINVNLPQLLCIVVSVALDGEFERFGGFCVDCYYNV